MKARIVTSIEKSILLLGAITQDTILISAIEQVTERVVQALNKGNKILFVGNGGSAADSQHLAAEFVSRFAFDRPGLAAFALTTDSSVLTAIGNDYGYENLFARQLEAVGIKGDVLFAISTSGKSQNVINGLRQARKMGLVTIGLMGSNQQDMAPYCDYCISVPSKETSKIQESHIIIGHTICSLVESIIFQSS
ncbi:MAG: D-sedoheptulose 7-phosphate isomerase [Candidatus Heimdallarchaeota archaeon]|nr:D-sedoheptulose 7-phosphate isomerase [Candidatus Heimdallarchaeota archaeon]